MFQSMYNFHLDIYKMVLLGAYVCYSIIRIRNVWYSVEMYCHSTDKVQLYASASFPSAAFYIKGDNSNMVLLLMRCRCL